MIAVGKSCRIEREQTFSTAFLMRFNSVALRCNFSFSIARRFSNFFSPFETLIVGSA